MAARFSGLTIRGGACLHLLQWPIFSRLKLAYCIRYVVCMFTVRSNRQELLASRLDHPFGNCDLHNVSTAVQLQYAFMPVCP